MTLDRLACILIVLTSLAATGLAISCYQCSSKPNSRYEDSCGAYKKFDRTEHIPIECNSEESHMPGTFCMKFTQQSPRGFIWNGRWRQVIRRCASVADTGVTGVCNWGVYDNGVYWEECYCSEEACNASTTMWSSLFVTASCVLAAIACADETVVSSNHFGE